MEGIVKGWIVALAVSVFAILLTSLLVGGSSSSSGRGPPSSPSSLSPMLNNSTGSSSSSSTTIVSSSNSQQQRQQQSLTRDILLLADETRLMIAPDNDLHPGGVWYNAMTFNGTIPGPAIFANQGDTLRITLKNQGEIVHSLNFHAGFGPSQALSGSVRPQESKTWTLKADYPGAFLYHCDGDNLNGIWEHIASGMYGGMIVRPTGEVAGEEPPAAKEFYIVFGEVYDTALVADSGPFTGNGSSMDSSSGGGGVTSQVGSFDMKKFLDRKPDLILTNGVAFKYMPWMGSDTKMILNKDAETFHVKVGEPTRWYIFNAGPRDSITFNFGAGMLRVMYENAGGYTSSNNTSPSFPHDYDEVASIPPGSATVIDVVFPEAGTYFGNDHDVGSLLYGAGFVVVAEK